VQASIPDLLRLVAVPVLGWAAIRDVRTRRVPNSIWWPLALLGVLLIAWEGFVLWNEVFGIRLYLIRVALSLGVVVPLSVGFWYLGGFGGADAKAFMAIAVLFPTYPFYEVLEYSLPFVETTLGVFSLSVLTNTVIVAMVIPVVLGITNLLRGRFSWVMFLGHRVPIEELPWRHGTLLETPRGLTRRGLDLDALRMYLRWRGIDLETLRSNPELVDPQTLPEEPNDPTDGAVSPDGGEPDSANLSEWEWTDVGTPVEDRWGAAAFLEDIETSAYGTTPETLRDGLDVVVEEEEVWVSPGIPFIVPTFVGLIVALVAGDILFWALGALGLV
jgi:preflagellin peptidase FlaK